MKIPFILYVLLLANVALGQKKIAASAVIDKTGILIGEQAQLELKVVIPPKNKISFFQVDTLPHFEILHESAVDTQQRRDTTILTKKLTITSWDSGTWQIPALKLAGSRTVQTKPIPVTISFSAFDPNQEYHGIKDILDVPKEKKNTWWWYVVISVLLIALFLLLFPGRKKQEPIVPVVKISAFELAMQELEKLDRDDPADHKDYYTRLIDIFRNYLQQRKGIHSFQKTTDDLGKQLLQLDMNREVYRNMLATLQLSDFVKFARYVPSAEERRQSLQTIKNTIQHIEPLKA